MSDKKQLLGDGEGDMPDPPKYGSGEPEVDVYASSEKSSGPCSCLTDFLYTHRASIPGYGMLKMLKASSLYSLYVLFILLMVYLINQLDRYTLPIVTSSAGYDLQYGDKYCMKSHRTNFTKYPFPTNITKICGNDTYLDEEFNITLNIK